MMKLRLTLRNLLSHSNYNRTIPGHTLHLRHGNRLPIRDPHLPRRKLRMGPPLPTRQRRLHILHLPIHARRPRPLLRLVYLQRNLKHWHHPLIHRNSHGLHRLRPAMRTNILLRGNSHYQPTLSNPLHWDRPGRMNLRGVLSRQSHSNTVLCFPLSTPLHYFSTRRSPPIILTRNRIKQPNGHSIRS